MDRSHVAPRLTLEGLVFEQFDASTSSLLARLTINVSTETDHAESICLRIVSDSSRLLLVEWDGTNVNTLDVFCSAYSEAFCRSESES